jgi:hypothetical protein
MRLIRSWHGALCREGPGKLGCISHYLGDMRIPYSNTPWFHVFLGTGAAVVMFKLMNNPPETGNMHLFVMSLAGLILIRSLVLCISTFRRGSPDE